MPMTRSGAPPTARRMRASYKLASVRLKRATARSPTPSAGAPRSATTTMSGASPSTPIARPCISPSRSTPVISTMPISGNAPRGRCPPPRGRRSLRRGCGLLLLRGCLRFTLGFRCTATGASTATAAGTRGAFRQQLDGAVHGQFLGRHSARQRRIDAVVTDISAVFAVEDFHRAAGRRMLAQNLDRFGRAAAEFARLGQQADRAVEADRQHVVVRRQRLVDLAVPDIGAEAADAGDDHFTVLRMRADVARQRQELERLLEIDVRGRDTLRERGAFGFFGRRRIGFLRAFSLLARRLRRGFAELDVWAVRPLFERDDQAGLWISAELTRLRGRTVFAVLEAQSARVTAFGIAGTADEGAEAPELEAKPALVAHRAQPRVAAIGSFRKKMTAKLFVERVNDLGDIEVLGAGDGGRKICPEIRQNLLPIDAAAGNVVELVLEVGGEIVLDVALEEFHQERGDEAATVLWDQPLLVELHILAVLQHLHGRGIGRRPADTELFELLDQARFGVTRRRLGEMLLRIDFVAGQRVTLVEHGQAAVFLVAFGIVGVLGIERQEAVEHHGRAGGSQGDRIVRRRDV